MPLREESGPKRREKIAKEGKDGVGRGTWRRYLRRTRTRAALREERMSLEEGRHEGQGMPQGDGEERAPSQ